VLKGLDYGKPVTSPTFTLVNEYDAKIPIIHIDCYRESESQRWIQLGLNDYLNEENIVIVEWADKMEKLLPRDTIQLKFVHRGTNTREIKLISS
jgi:tRNA threonylcarbamoyladenosine biosynthesis protein TsaE